MIKKVKKNEKKVNTNKLPMEITLFENLPVLFLNFKTVSKKTLSIAWANRKKQTQKTRRLVSYL
ncbi:MAG: hypothetical protein ACKVE4_05180 [Dissulfuribacterales bacterium]